MKGFIQWICGENICDGELPCPTHKRFCSPVGCLYECPESMYVNGSTCVVSCGDWYAMADRSCQQHCLDDFYVREKVIQNGQDIYLEKQCISSCAQSEYIFYGTCVRACPAEFLFIYNNSCVASCPVGFQIRENISLVLHIEYLHKQCIETCDISEFMLNGMCIKACPEGMRYTNRNVCAANCLPEHIYFQNFTRNGIVHHDCVEKCPKFEENGYCVEQCSIGNVYFESSCLAKCPYSNPLTYLGTCVERCSSVHYMLSQNMSCLLDCPEHSLRYETDPDNKTCVYECPSDAPMMCDSICNKYMSDLKSGICVKRCPPVFPFINNNVCVSVCPSVSLNGTCISNCPPELPYAVIKGERRYSLYYGIFMEYTECNATCEPRHYEITQKKSCVEICPENMVIVNRTCLQTCPSEFPYMKNESVRYQAITYERYTNGLYVQPDVSVRVVYRYRCTNDCGIGNATYNLTCYDMCPRESGASTLKYHNGVCMKNCPDSHRFIGNRTMNTSCDFDSMCEVITWQYECLENCLENTFIYGNYCVNDCPSNMTAYQQICVNVCPKEFYKEKVQHTFFIWTPKKNYIYYYSSAYTTYYERMTVSVLTQICVTACKNSVLNGDSCEQSCPLEQKYLSENVCHNKTCLSKYERNSSFGIECLIQCPDGTYLHANKCVNNCPNGMVLYASECLTLCPLSDPYTFTLVSGKYYWAFDKNGEWKSEHKMTENTFCCRICPKGFLFNMTCIDECPETTNIIVNGECKSDCLAGYVLLRKNNEFHCIQRCPPEYVLGPNRTCTETCPITLKYNYDGVCVLQCPNAKPFGSNVKNWNSKEDVFKCLFECEDSKLFKQDEEICVYQISCEKPYFAYDRQCLLRCPQGYLWFESCFSELAAGLAIGGIFIVSVIVIILFSRTAKDTLCFMKILYNQKNQDAVSSEDYKVFLETGTTNSNKTLLEVSLDMIDVSDSYVFQTLGSNCFVNKSFTP